MTPLDVLSSFDRLAAPDRMTDAKIGELLAPEMGFIGVSWNNGEPYFSGKGSGYKVWKYTASIDSAIRIIPKGWYLEEVYKESLISSYEVTVKSNGLAITVKSKTLSVAVCIAALRARALEIALSQHNN